MTEDEIFQHDETSCQVLCATKKFFHQCCKINPLKALALTSSNFMRGELKICVYNKKLNNLEHLIYCQEEWQNIKQIDFFFSSVTHFFCFLVRNSKMSHLFHKLFRLTFSSLFILFSKCIFQLLSLQMKILNIMNLFIKVFDRWCFVNHVSFPRET